MSQSFWYDPEITSKNRDIVKSEAIMVNPMRAVTKTAKKARFSLLLQYMKVIISFYPVFRWSYRG
jgi:hypothetical protein